MTNIFVELGVVGALILVNGALSLSEMAVVSSRPARLKLMESQGVSGARLARQLFSNPGRFLSTVQVGITLVGILSGLVSGATLGLRLGHFLQSFGVSTSWADSLAFAIVVASVTYVSLVLGELVPKRVAMQNPEKIACLVAPCMFFIARFSAPAIFLLDYSSRFLVTILGKREGNERCITEEEIKTLIAEAESEGILEPEEHRMITGVLRLADRSVASMMIPRTDVEMADLKSGLEDLSSRLLESSHSRLIVYEDSPDEILGVLRAQDVLSAFLKTGTFEPKSLLKPASIVADTMDAMESVEVLKTSPSHVGLVYDEYGHFLGIITPSDILKAIVGVFEEEEGETEASVVQRYDGSYLISGSVAVDEFSDLLGIKLPQRRHYSTVAGFVLDQAGRIPAVGDVFDVQGWQIEVVDLDGRRVDRVLAAQGRSLHRGAVLI